MKEPITEKETGYLMGRKERSNGIYTDTIIKNAETLVTGGAESSLANTHEYEYSPKRAFKW